MGVEAYNYSSVIMFYLFLITSFIVPHAKGENYIVGDSYGWIDFVDFNNWCDGKEFHVGDVLVYESCIKDSYMKKLTSGNDSIVLEKGGAWFICGVDDHCENGQKLHINVTP
ncbi:blue copper protein isoform X2 [Vigna umbellata]|uniref:blue copper protein isoform X2 n=1 Tax=Vigna umbellata TaxID=87088 RepID=UPI001F5E6461|nr:blue copper protein isoform X2 [Vigna umbellata]